MQVVILNSNIPSQIDILHAAILKYYVIEPRYTV